MGNHAKYSPSSSARWLNCTASMLLETKTVERESEFAKRGTALHSMAEDILVNGKFESSYDGYTPTQEDIEETVNPYIDYVNAIAVDERFYEMKVKITDECFGTADFIGYNTVTDTLHIVDLKAGQGVKVSVFFNTQLQIYAIGAFKYFKLIGRDVKKVIIHIAQPGLENFQSLDVPIQNLKELFVKIKKTVDNVNNKDVEYKASDSSCRWCIHKVTCPELNNLAVKSAKKDFDEDCLSDRMKLVPMLKLFIKAVEEETFRYMSCGGKVKDFKMVKGRGRRSWKDETRILDDLELFGVYPPLLYTPGKLLSVAQMEKMLKKKKIDYDLSKYVEIMQGAPRVVSETDAGEAIDSTKEAIADFS